METQISLINSKQNLNVEIPKQDDFHQLTSLPFKTLYFK
jgi:hypothetical protein